MMPPTVYVSFSGFGKVNGGVPETTVCRRLLKEGRIIFNSRGGFCTVNRAWKAGKVALKKFVELRFLKLKILSHLYICANFIESKKRLKVKEFLAIHKMVVCVLNLLLRRTFFSFSFSSIIICSLVEY